MSNLALGTDNHKRILRITKSLGNVYYLYRSREPMGTYGSYEEALEALKKLGTLKWDSLVDA